jgi:hypothetical protein
MSLIKFIKENKKLTAGIILLIILCVVLIIYRFTKKNKSVQKSESTNITGNITNVMQPIDINFNGNFGNKITQSNNMLNNKINIGEYMDESSELVSPNKKYIVKFMNGMLVLVNNKYKVIRSLDMNIRYTFIQKTNYNYTQFDKQKIGNGLLMLTKNQINDNNNNIKITILNNTGKIGEFGNMGKDGYLQLDDCGNLILYVDGVEKLDLFNLVELN